jgi:hypothetical protein
MPTCHGAATSTLRPESTVMQPHASKRSGEEVKCKDVRLIGAVRGPGWSTSSISALNNFRTSLKLGRDGPVDWRTVGCTNRINVGKNDRIN